jgi:hypothetical protein
MRVTVAAIAGGAAALAAASTLGVAAAESTGGGSTPPVRTIAVGGVGQAPVPQSASSPAADSAYRQALAAAISDGLGKAEFLAAKVSATVGPVQSLSEQGGYITCSDGEGGYVQYEGEQPDFPGSAARPVPLPAVGAPSRGHRLVRPRRRAKAHRATSGSCSVRANVSLAYQIG